MSRLTRQERRNLLTGLAFISPWLVGFAAFLAFPIGASLYYSFTEFSVLLPPQYIGAENYRELAGDEVFWQALGNTVFYAAWALPLGTLLALALALLLNTGARGMAFFRTFFFLPSLVPTIALALLWLWIFNGSFGVLNHLLPALARLVAWCLLALPLLGFLWLLAGALRGGRHRPPNATLGTVGALAALGLLAILAGLPGWAGGFQPPNWLADPHWVKPALIMMSLWSVGHAMVIYLAGLQGVPAHLLEAAEIDGARVWGKIRHVTLPLISPVILFNVIMGIIATFNFFAIPFVMTPGGRPARAAYFLAVNLYDNAYQFLRMGYASAMAWILFLIVFALTMLALRISRGRVHYGGGA